MLKRRSLSSKGIRRALEDEGIAISISYPTAAGLGLIQGLTEFLPVSSSGHLRLAEAWIGGITQPLTLELALHVGTLGAVLVYYRKDLITLIGALLPGGDSQARQQIGKIVLASIPTAVIGLGLKKAGVEHLGPQVVAGGLFATACLNESTNHTGGGEQEITYGKAFGIGVIQGIAVLPGISRSGSTIATAMALGIPSLEAARFSFLCSVPAVGGATLLLVKDLVETQGATYQWGPLGLGIGVSFLVGYVCLALLMKQLERGGFRLWAVYCLIVSILVLWNSRGG